MNIISIYIIWWVADDIFMVSLSPFRTNWGGSLNLYGLGRLVLRHKHMKYLFLFFESSFKNHYGQREPAPVMTMLLISTME